MSFINQRTNQIIDYLKSHKKATVTELSEALFASESSIRRDLKEMQNSGVVARYHGGAVLLDETSEISMLARSEFATEEKNACAEIALRHMPDQHYNTVFIDNSSTCLNLARRMDFTNKTVITNGLQVALQLSQKPNINVVILGGSVNVTTAAACGSFTKDMLDMFNIDFALVSCAAIDIDGCYEFTLETSRLKKRALEKCKHSMLIASENKFKINASYRTSNLSDIHYVITNASDKIIEPFVQNNIQIFNK